ncbi:hypothetical protein GCK72_022409 [Caenorhabditis remanei]|uniref:Uncharacterized protein n=1 Tax=Caenorhabditis remanei TaxID=31234 RepID=A0A6A5FU99_CAERE|nr:hypothetical protein GCK72_022409 [Caenorhabditis remanei]KAF1745961.1 hypothetical protein GCK72_022409 [Caenorhabditis remanei]
MPSPSRLTSATSSPVESLEIQKSTPPHRMTREKKNAHLANAPTNKEKSTNLNTLPLRGVLHQDDTLAVVQSIFESNKPRHTPYTPKDRKATSKIADSSRFSADEFNSDEGTSNTGQRSIIGGSRAQNYTKMVQPHLHH